MQITEPDTRVTTPLSPLRCTALYLGALLGTSLLLLPGLAADLAGPASIVAWGGLLVLSALLATVFATLGRRIRGGVVEFTAAGLGIGAGRVVRHCFLAGVVLGAPVVCLIGGGYVADLVGGGRGTAVATAAGLLVVVVALTVGGARIGTAVQLGLVGVLIALVAVAILGSAPAARAEHWTPFAPHGWSAVGPAASALMLSFVGWEAVAPLIGRLRDPQRSLPRVIGAAFVITSTIFLGLAVAVIGVLGPNPGTVPLADLLRVAVGEAGGPIATIAALALTVAAVNAYLLSATELSGRGRSLPIWVGVIGVLVLGTVATGAVDVTDLVAIPTVLFLVVYLGCTASAVRITTGRVRVVALLATVAVTVMLISTVIHLIGSTPVI